MMRMWQKRLIVFCVAAYFWVSHGYGTDVLQGRLNVNTATQSELALLPGIGKKKAKLIVLSRRTNPFVSVDDLRKVKGISKRTVEALTPYIKTTGTSNLVVVKSKGFSEK